MCDLEALGLRVATRSLTMLQLEASTLQRRQHRSDCDDRGGDARRHGASCPPRARTPGRAHVADAGTALVKDCAEVARRLTVMRVVEAVEYVIQPQNGTGCIT